MKTSLKSLFIFSSWAAFAATPLVRADNTAPASASTPAAAAAPATDQKTSHQYQDDYLATLAKELGLTNAQEARLAPILENHEVRMEALRAATLLSADQRKAKGKQIDDETRKQIRAQLTADQQRKLDALKGP
jgi:hypothetical protein